VFCQQCGNPTEIRLVEDRERPVCVSCGWVTYLDPKLAVAVVIERNGSILLGRRAGSTRNPGKWSFPAGFVERGEQVELAALRETKEETGLDLTLGPLLGLFSETGETVVLAVYAATADGEPVAGDDLTEIAWYPLDGLPELAFAHDLRIIDAWKTVHGR
jgi:ADP-ribose pyrophosphatase YjhB (NUDIX family)